LTHRILGKGHVPWHRRRFWLVNGCFSWSDCIHKSSLPSTHLAVRPLIAESSREDRLLRAESLGTVAERFRADGDGVFCSLSMLSDSFAVLRRRLGKGILG
jgi:hypothetical protein